MDIREATQKWVDSFNAIPQSLIIKAYQDNIDDIQEITPIIVGDNVWSNGFQETVEVTGYDSENDTYEITCSDGTIECNMNKYDLYLEHDSWLPMWGWMWTFGDDLDSEWAYEHLQDMADCGFRIYECDELGLVFGIDGAGYDFYESHWIPLYKARGLQWHDEEII